LPLTKDNSPNLLSQIKVSEVKLVVVTQEVNIFVSLQAKPTFFPKKKERILIQADGSICSGHRRSSQLLSYYVKKEHQGITCIKNAAILFR
jgi:hypothetical protein